MANLKYIVSLIKRVFFTDTMFLQNKANDIFAGKKKFPSLNS